jgi:hypothetical protein
MLLPEFKSFKNKLNSLILFELNTTNFENLL